MLRSITSLGGCPRCVRPRLPNPIQAAAAWLFNTVMPRVQCQCRVRTLLRHGARLQHPHQLVLSSPARDLRAFGTDLDPNPQPVRSSWVMEVGGQPWRRLVLWRMVWYGMVWYGMVWYGMVSPPEAKKHKNSKEASFAQTHQRL